MTKLVFAILPTVGGKAREEYIAKLTATSAYSKANEPGVLTYAVCLPRDETDQKTVYMIEAYSDQAAFDAHMKIEKVQDMIQWMGANPVLEAAPTVLELDVVEDFGLFTRGDAIQSAKDPHIVFGEVSYKDADLAEKSLAHWAKVVQTTKNDEPGSLVYALTRSNTNPATLYTFEAYTSKDYLWDVHAKSQAVQDNVKETSDWRAGLKHHVLKQVDGFLARAKI
ncbi:hypothetical protein SEUCBS139899_010598 [Sporothrix eucalyptigena]|uniref:ABM domain-containing protein n=1 Tax=Sporothrix eucalyptigena TaxID=1812306 RepID=A0ABP0CVA7_9PEZI